MKVNIGPYRTWIGPYQIAEKILFWLDKYEDDRVHDFGHWLAGGDEKESLLYKLCLWIDKFKKRKIKVKIDYYDTWSMDHTLAHMILPMLKQLHATKQGAPFVDDEDVPEHLRSTAAEPKENEWDTDSNHFKRWDWVLDEMIQAFECKVNEDWEERYWTGKSEGMDFKEDGTIEFLGNRKCDWDALKAHQLRNKNGYRLFGKYYEALWD